MFILSNDNLNIGDYFAYENDLYKFVEIIPDEESSYRWAKCLNIILDQERVILISTKCIKLDMNQIRNHVEYHLEKMEEKAARLKNALNEVGG